MFVKWEEKNYKLVECVKFVKLGPGRPSAGGPRMDRRTVTSPITSHASLRACGAQLAGEFYN